MTPTGVIRTYAQTNKWRLQASFGANGLMSMMQHNVIVRATTANSFEGITKGLQHHCNDFGTMDRVHVHGEEVVIYTVYSWKWQCMHQEAGVRCRMTLPHAKEVKSKTATFTHQINSCMLNQIVGKVWNILVLISTIGSRPKSVLHCDRSHPVTRQFC